jgi:hypothetical protein
MFYGKVNVTESGRVNPTYKQETDLNESGKTLTLSILAWKTGIF